MNINQHQTFSSEMNVNINFSNTNINSNCIMRSSTVRFENGKKIEIPFNWEGYDQKNRKKFFGVIDVPIPPNLLKETIVVHITFPDSGGHLSTLILDVDEFESFKD